MAQTEPGDSATYRRIAEAFDDLGQQVRAAGPEQTLEAVVDVAVKHVPGTAWASVTVLRQQEFRTVAASSDIAVQADKLQYAVGSGPCLDAILYDAVYRPTDLSVDRRWPEFGHRVAAEFGVRSMLSFRLSGTDDVIAGLNLYAQEIAAFTDSATELGLLLATHASTVLGAALNKERAENLARALESNRDIGVAIGVLMSQHGVTRQQAFDLLRVASHHTNRKLHQVAIEVADTGTLPVPHRPHARRVVTDGPMASA